MNRQLPALFDIAAVNDVLPALAVRCNDQQVSTDTLSEHQRSKLEQALIDNTVRNMQIKAQALKITTQLNRAGITPLFLKGTVQLLDPSTKDLGFRKQVDIDLLVAPEQLEVAANVFLDTGYTFYNINAGFSSETTLPLDTPTAIRRSAAHHHLPPLVKEGYATTVELHRHFLPKRFQRKNPLEPLFETAHEQQYHGARYLTPALEYQLIHLLLGKMINDGHLARLTFPVREACDYLKVIESGGRNIDQGLIKRHCEEVYPIFSSLVEALMMHREKGTSTYTRDLSRRILIMQKRYDFPGIAKLLDTRARLLHLANSLLHNPAKLPAYVNRIKKTPSSNYLND